MTIVLFRNCNSTTGFDAILDYTLFNANNTVYSTYNVPVFSIVNVPPDESDPCVIIPPGICVDRATYIDTITIPPSNMGYYFSYQRCCWANDIVNMVNPGSNGLTLTCLVPPGFPTPLVNQAARFNAEPPLVLCSNITLDFDHSATDPDGDSLRYYICDPDNFPLVGGNNSPNPENPGPYLPISWEVGFSTLQPFGPGSSMTLDSITGALSITPQLLGNFMTGVCVAEYRNGVLIDVKKRTYDITVVNCAQIIPFTITAKTEGIAIGNTNNLIEDCGIQYFYLSRLDSTDTLNLTITVTGTATNGVDFNSIPALFSMLPGTLNDTIVLVPFADNIIEPTETAQLVFKYLDVCSDNFDSLVVNLNINDYQPLKIHNPLDSINICPDTPENAELSTVVENGIGPYSYYWVADSNEYYPNQTSITVGPDHIQDLINPYYVTVTDQCGKKITSDVILVYNQCQLIIPNVVTNNQDGVNEVFIIKNLQDYKTIHFTVFNRWGEVIYESQDYKNDWTVRYKNGTPLLDGVYFYTVEVVNDKKYIYDDQEKTKYQAQGFFQVLK